MNSKSLSLLAIVAMLPLPAPRARAQGGSPLADKTWVRLGGPFGGLGYDIRLRPDNPDVMFVTDSFAGLHVSTDGGMTLTHIRSLKTCARGAMTAIMSVERGSSR